MTGEDVDTAGLLKFQEAEHWRLILEGCDAIAGGEKRGKVVHVLSGLSSGMQEKLHLYVMSKTQGGKSWLQRRLGTQLFPNFEEANSSSPKAPYYEAKNDPKCFENTIRMYDEFPDQGFEFQSQIKALTSHGVRSVTLKTVEIDRKFLKVTIDGLPVVWINSETPVQDEQVLNRFFKMNLDESGIQDELVEKFQKEEEKLGDQCKRHQGVIVQARNEIASILSDKNVCVLNPFAEFWDVIVPGNRSVRPMISTLVKTLAYSNRAIRPQVWEGTILASLSDNIVGFFVWSWYEPYQIWKVPERHLRLLGALEPHQQYTKGQLSEAYSAKYPSEKKLSSDTCYQYAHHLEKLNLIGSEGDWTGKTWHLVSIPGQANEVKYGQGGALAGLTFRTLEFRFPTSDELANALRSIRNTGLAGLSGAEMMEDVDELSIELLDWDYLLRIAKTLEVDLPSLSGISQSASSETVLDPARIPNQAVAQEASQ